MKTVRCKGISLSYDKGTKTYMYRFARGKMLVEEAVYFDPEPAVLDALRRMYKIGKEAERNKLKG